MDAQDIKLKIHEEAELYSPLDPEQNMLSEEVTAFLERVFLNRYRRLREKHTIRIISDTPVDAERVKAAFRAEYESQKDDVRYALRQLTLKGILLAVAGVAILSLWLYLSAKTETVGVEVVSIMGWVFVWEATSIFFMERPGLMREWYNLDLLLRSEIRVEVTGETE